jgi:hypothetical protein
MTSRLRAHDSDSNHATRIGTPAAPELSRRRAAPDNAIYTGLTNGLPTSQSNESLLSHSSSFDAFDALESPTTPKKLGKRDSLPLNAGDLSDGDGEHDAFGEQNGKGAKLDGQESLAFLYAIITWVFFPTWELGFQSAGVAEKRVSNMG